MTDQIKEGNIPEKEKYPPKEIDPRMAMAAYAGPAMMVYGGPDYFNNRGGIGMFGIPVAQQPAEPKNTEDPDAKFCPECGAKLYKDAKFCHECGVKLKTDAETVV